MSKTLFIAVGPARGGKTSLCRVLQAAGMHVTHVESGASADVSLALNDTGSVFVSCDNSPARIAEAAKAKDARVHVVVCSTPSDAVNLDAARLEAEDVNVVKLMRASEENSGALQTWTVKHCTVNPDAKDTTLKSSAPGDALALFVDGGGIACL